MLTLLETIQEGDEDFLRGQALGVYGASLSPDGGLLAYGVHGRSHDGHSHGRSDAFRQDHFTLKLRETADLTPPRNQDGVRLSANTRSGLIAFSPDGSLLATASARHVDLWRMPDGRQIAMRDYPSRVNGVIFSPDGTWLGIALEGYPLPGNLGGRGVALWEIGVSNPMLGLKAFIPTSSPIRSILFYREVDRLYLIYGGADGRLWALDCTDGIPPHADPAIWYEASDPVQAMSTGYEPTLLAIGVRGMLIRSDRQIHRQAESRLTTACAVLPDGDRVICGTDHGHLRVWSVSRQRYLWEKSSHKQGVNAIAFTENGNLLVTSGGDRCVRIWRVDEHER